MAQLAADSVLHNINPSWSYHYCVVLCVWGPIWNQG